MADKAKFLGGLDLDCYSTIGLHRRIADTGAIANSRSRGYHRSRAVADTDSLVDTTPVSNDSSTAAGALAHPGPFPNTHPWVSHPPAPTTPAAHPLTTYSGPSTLKARNSAGVSKSGPNRATNPPSCRVMPSRAATALNRSRSFSS